MSQGFDKYSESVGHLVMTEDGAITNVSRFSDVDAQLNVRSLTAKQVVWSVDVSDYEITHKRVDACWPNTVGMDKAWTSTSDEILLLVRFQVCIPNHFLSHMSILMLDIDIAILSVRLSVRHVPVY